MHLVDEEEDLPVGFHDLIEHGLQPFLELAAEFRARDERAHVERVERLVLQRLRHITRDDAAGKAFDNGRLADARLADEHRVVLRAPREDLDRATDLLVTADDRIELARPRGRREVAAVFLERLVALLRILARDVLLAVLLDRALDVALRELEIVADGLHILAAVRHEREQEMLGAHIVVLHDFRVFLRLREHAHHVHAHREAILPLDAWNLRELLLETRAEHAEIDAAVVKNRLQQPLRLLREREQRVERRDLLVIAQGRRLLRGLQRGQRLCRIFFFSHHKSLLSRSCFLLSF